MGMTILGIWIVGMFVTNILVHWFGWFEYDWDPGRRLLCTILWPFALVFVGIVGMCQAIDRFCQYLVSQVKRQEKKEE